MTLPTRLLIGLACLWPAGHLAWDYARGGLGVNPITEITHRTGRWTLILLLVTLAFTPLRRLTGWNGLIRWRRTVGLFAFFYATLHFANYVVLDYFFAWELIVEDIAERPYITVGFTAFVLLIPLAATSNRFAVRKLRRNWQRLHRLIYVSAGLGVLHFLWLVKAPDIARPTKYGAVLAVLLVLRLPPIARRLGARSWWRRRQRLDGRAATGSRPAEP